MTCTPFLSGDYRGDDRSGADSYRSGGGHDSYRDGYNGGGSDRSGGYNDREGGYHGDGGYSVQSERGYGNRGVTMDNYNDDYGGGGLGSFVDN